MDGPAALTLQEAADRLGVHYMTVYRYLRIGRLDAQRSGGRWLVEVADVDRLRETARRPASRRRGPGRSDPPGVPGAGVPGAGVAGAGVAGAGVAGAGVAGAGVLGGGITGATVPRAVGARAGAAAAGVGAGMSGATGPPIAVPASERLVSRLTVGDGAGCWAVVEEALVSGSPTDVYLNLIVPALRRLGDGWTDGSISVAREHRATACALRMVGRLSPLFSRPGRRRWGTVVLAGAPGDRHVIPLTMVGDVLRGEGFDVVDLGADVPCASLLEVLGEVPDLLAVGLSVSTDGALTSASATVASLHKSHPGVPVLVGGPAVAQPSAADALGADYWAPDAVATAQLLIRLSEHRRVAAS